MDIKMGNTIKAYSTEELLEELKRRGDNNTIIIDKPSISYYVNVPALNVDIRAHTDWASKEKVVITITKLK